MPLDDSQKKLLVLRFKSGRDVNKPKGSLTLEAGISIPGAKLYTFSKVQDCLVKQEDSSNGKETEKILHPPECREFLLQALIGMYITCVEKLSSTYYCG